MAETTVTCPKCKEEFKLNESLAAPLVESMRQAFEQRLRAQNAEVAKREQAMKEREAALAQARELVDQQVMEKLKTERAKLCAEEAKKATLALKNDIDEKAREVANLQAVLKTRDEKLAEAQKAQSELLRKQRELDDQKRELDLTIEKRVSASVADIREQASRAAEEQSSLKIMEREQIIESMKKQIDELKRKAEQGSQQLQGEVMELRLEALLGGRFPHDRIDPVPKGEHGGDVLHRVITPVGSACGTILWESKRTKNWQDGWLAKLREDQRTAKAEVAIIVSAVLPRSVETFDQVDDVWIVHPRALLPVAHCLRQGLIEISCARQANQGQETKMALVYQYLTGPKFRLRIQAIKEAFETMADDLRKEKNAMVKQWAKREEQINRVMEATCGMYGELQGIAGRTMQEIEGFDLLMLEGPAED